MMLGAAQRLVKHSSIAGLGQGRMVSVSTGSKFATHPSSDLSITETGLSDSGTRFEWEKRNGQDAWS
jgi:hypothetical protein